MTLDDARKHYIDYFTEKIEQFGASPQGVDYNSPTAQDVRFEQLIKVIQPEQPFSIIDYGCGYGALFDFLCRKNCTFEYYGFDLIEKMIAAGREAHKEIPNAHFFTYENELPTADYLVAGAIFNNKFEADTEVWTKMILETLQRMDRLCTKGFSFNMLTSYSDADRMAQRPSNW
jgi:SAM-dependent methyltransferase